jgi:hypothetical protein
VVPQRARRVGQRETADSGRRLRSLHTPHSATDYRSEAQPILWFAHHSPFFEAQIIQRMGRGRNVPVAESSHCLDSIAFAGERNDRGLQADGYARGAGQVGKHR